MTNQKQITYFFGAGASYNAIPTIDGLSDRINCLIAFLNKIKDNADAEQLSTDVYLNIISKKETLAEIINELEWLIQESEFHQTVDTLAKKLHLQGDKESLCRLKRALIIYFFFEQNIKFDKNPDNPHNLLLDKRYDNLIASIAYSNKNGINFKEHVKIITWNYDLQIDLAIKNYFDGHLRTLNWIKNKKQIHPNKNLFKPNTDSLVDYTKFAVLKLNGNAFLDNYFNNNQQDEKTVNDCRFGKTKITDLEIFVKFLEEYDNVFSKYIKEKHQVYKFFNFAWETKEEKTVDHEKLIEAAAKIMEDTDILIIVGYSFPYFNSEIDKRLFANCNPKEIIIQDLEPEQIKDRVSLLLSKYTKDDLKNKIKFQNLSKYFPIHPET